MHIYGFMKKNIEITLTDRRKFEIFCQLITTELFVLTRNKLNIILKITGRLYNIIPANNIKISF